MVRYEDQADRLSGGDRQRAGLPITDFLYTLDQVAYVLGISIGQLEGHVRFMGEATKPVDGAGKDRRMVAVSLKPSSLHDRKEWRVPQEELVRYLRRCGLVVYERRIRV